MVEPCYPNGALLRTYKGRTRTKTYGVLSSIFCISSSLVFLFFLRQCLDVENTTHFNQKFLGMFGYSFEFFFLFNKTWRIKKKKKKLVDFVFLFWKTHNFIETVFSYLKNMVFVLYIFSKWKNRESIHCGWFDRHVHISWNQIMIGETLHYFME